MALAYTAEEYDWARTIILFITRLHYDKKSRLSISDVPTLEQFPEESQRERPGSGTYSTGHASYPRVALLYPSLRSFLYDNPTLPVRRWLIVVILAIGETTAMGVCRTREDAGSGYGQNTGEECYAKE